MREGGREGRAVGKIERTFLEEGVRDTDRLLVNR